ncbi:hypothetical protein BDR26DRAFT_864006 [Obelidium mucronatum]|nr:hypothetical protein BDR26DRAFT_864006 [Obelidium mucronatum]
MDPSRRAAAALLLLAASLFLLGFAVQPPRLRQPAHSLPLCPGGQVRNGSELSCALRLDAVAVVLAAPTTEIGSAHGFRVQPLSVANDPVAVGLANSPSFVAILEHEANLERMFLYPTTVYGNGSSQFSFTLFAAGVFQVSILVEGAIDLNWPHTIPWSGSTFRNLTGFKNDTISFAPAMKLLHRFNLTVVPSLTFQNTSQAIDQYTENLSPCELKHFSDFQSSGRWISTELFSHELQSQIKPLSKDHARLFFLPHNCKLLIYSSEKARECLAGKKLTFLGDSTMREIFNHFVDYARIQKTENDARIHPTDSCNRERVYDQDPIGVSLNLIWTPNINPCHNAGPGLVSLLVPGYLERLRFKLGYNYKELPHHNTGNDSNFMETARNKSGAYKKSDFAFINGGLHDIGGMKNEDNEDGLDYRIDEFPHYLATMLDEMKANANHVTYMTVNPKLTYSYFFLRSMSTVGRELSASRGIPVLDYNGIQNHRLNGNGKPFSGDIFHTTENGPWVHVSTQLLLNSVCPQINPK